ncbi:MAG: tetratricopeptide repeat protein [Parvibaculaceae bacterium]|nr:tetratricopeptide repeat protein [Parvibaculaceae bacterium]
MGNKTQKSLTHRVKAFFPASLVATTLLLTVTGLSACSSGFLSQPSARNTDTLFGNYLAGRYAGSQRELDDAAKFLGRALDKDPGNPVLIERTFLLAVTAGEVEHAISLAQEIIVAEPKDRNARLLLSLDHLKHNQYDQAMAQIDSAAPGPFTALVGTLTRAWASAGEGNGKAAFAALDAFKGRRAFELFRAYHDALIADYLGDTDRAASSFAEALKSSGGGSLRIVQSYGRFLERAGKWEEAKSIYQQYALLSPDHPIMQAALKRVAEKKPAPIIVTTPAKGVAEALYSLGSALAQDNGLDVSIIYLQMALYLNEDFEVARTLLADLLDRVGRIEDSITTFNDIDKDSPLYVTAQLQVALSLDSLNRVDEAMDVLEAIARREPENADPYIARGDMQRGRENFAQAVLEYGDAIKRAGPPEPRHWSIYYARGVCYERLGDWPRAEKDLKLADALSGGHPLVLNYLGYSWVEQKLNLDEAMAMIRKAVTRRPNDGFIVDSLGWAHFRLGDFAKAVMHLEKAAELQPEDPTINDHLGDAYWRVGRQTEARFQWQRAIDMKPEDAEIMRIQNKLKSGLEAMPLKDAAAL